MSHAVTLLSTQFITHDVKQFIISRPPDFHFEPGEGVELAVDAPGWERQGRPFTPTSLPDAGVLEFIIKGYPEHHGVTEQLHRLVPGDGLRLSHESFGTIRYRGPGTFIAAGAGITPFLAIIRRLAREGELTGQRLIYSNKASSDIIAERELRHYFAEQAQFLCTREADCRCQGRRIDRDYLQATIDDLSQQFYVCGPPPFVEAINRALVELGAVPEAVIFEK